MSDPTTTAGLAAYSHCFHQDNPSAERSTGAVLWITLVAMALEITADWW